VALLNSPRRYRSTKLPRAERDRKIVALKAHGVTISAIADQVGCSTATVSRVVHHHLQELQAEIRAKAGQIRAQHLLELRHLRARLARGVAAGDVQSVNAWLKILQRESALLGLDLSQPAADEAAAHNAAQALLQRLADNLDPDTMNTIVGILSVGEDNSDANS